MKFFTILTVLKDSIPDLLKTSLSVKNQKFTNYEHLIFQSSNFVKTKKKIKLLRLKNTKIFKIKDQSFYDGVNKVLCQNIIRSKYLILLNAGDLFCNPNTLLNVYKRVKNQKNKLFYCDIAYFN